MQIRFSDYLKSNNEVFARLDAAELDGMRTELSNLADSGSTLWVAGNGGSEATASHFVADMVKSALQFGDSSLRTVALTEQAALNTALVNDTSFRESLGEQLRLVAREGDAYLYLSVSGLSPNLVHAAEVARSLNVKTMAIVGERGADKAKEICDFSITVPSDDYQVVENAHIVIMHWFCKALSW